MAQTQQVADVQRQIRESLGLPPVLEVQPTVPVEGHVCEFPLWSYSKKRAGLTRLHIAYDPSLTVARYMILKLFISTGYRWYPMYLGCLFCLFVYVEFFRICLQ